MTDSTPLPPAGWYPDTTRPGLERYWDGTTWTDQSRPLSTGVTHQVAGTAVISPPKKRKKWPWIVAASVVGVLMLIIIIGSLNSKPTVSADPKPASVPSASASDDPVAAPTPTPEPVVDDQGSLTNPFPIGYPVSITESGADYYTMTAKLISADASGDIAQANQFNDPAPNGMKYVLVEFTFTGANADNPVRPGSALYSWQLADQDGKLYNDAIVVTPGESISGAPELYKGQTFTGQTAYLVPVGTTKLFMSTLGKYLALN